MDAFQSFGSSQKVEDRAPHLFVVVYPGDVVDFEIAPPLVVLFLVVDVPLVAVDRGGRVRLRQASIGCLQMKGEKVVVVLLLN